MCNRQGHSAACRVRSVSAEPLPGGRDTSPDREPVDKAGEDLGPFDRVVVDPFGPTILARYCTPEGSLEPRWDDDVAVNDLLLVFLQPIFDIADKPTSC